MNTVEVFWLVKLSFDVLFQITTGEKRDDGKIMGEDGTAFKHTPAESLTEKKKAEKLRQKIEERRNKRDIEKKLKKVKGLGESDSDGDDTQKWIERSRKLEKKKVFLTLDLF